MSVPASLPGDGGELGSADNLGVDPSVARMRRVSKRTGGWRALCELEPDLRERYEIETAALVRRLGPRTDPADVAIRATAPGDKVMLESASKARRRFARARRSMSEEHRGPFVVADGLDCYASISL
jgi:hypothetical protein